ncbi:MAG: helicase-exonuclease AddAB subunit AddA [Lachnospiraceae bacterium]|nr:helicase-exonuclease AddAB subunit AddA [Lachnospiraceae bacterium]
MAEVKYTDEQKAVIESRRENLLVSAAAGSGKTAVLTARILSLMTDKEHPVDIDRMLIVTYTRAAAAEMRERIGKAIADHSAAHPEDERMERQSALLHNAQITTIDSFCLFVVRNNFADIALDPGFRILDEGEKKLMLADALDDVIREAYESGDGDFLHLAESYADGVWDNSLQELVLKLYDFVCSHPQPEQWLREAWRDAAPESIEAMEATDWYRYGRKRYDELLERMKSLSDRAVELCRMDAGPSAYLPAASELAGLAELLLQQESYARRQQIFAAADLPKLSSGKKKTEDPELRAKAKALIDKARDIFAEAGEGYTATEESLKECAPHIRRDLEGLCKLCLSLMERFSELKRERGVVDFTDMEHFALQILLRENEKGELAPTAAAEEYREHFEQIFVDEYQDSNYVQEYILRSIAREDDYFCVGDVKQSIYRFRMARPEIFLEKYERYGETGPDQRIDLNRNFRSREEVLSFVNRIFRVIMNKAVAGLDYDEKAELVRGEDYYPEAVGREYESEIDVLYTKEAEELLEEDEPAPGKLVLECRMVAERIRELMHSGFVVWDKEEKVQRPLRYGDIVLLSRSTADYEQPLREVFAEYDIPVYCAGRSGYFKAPEVRCLLSALRVIDNPRQDMPLHATLVHFLELFSEEEAAVIRGAGGKGELYDALRAYPGTEGARPELVKKLEGFFELLGRFREYARYMKVRELIERLIRETDYLIRVAAQPAGAQRAANIRLLLERATAYEQSSYKGLFHFIRYLGQLKEQEVDFGEALAASENADVVRTMTIHKSKGLEFPVVFCLGFYRRFNRRDASEALLLDPGLGIAANAVDPVRRLRFKGAKRSILAGKLKEDMLAEDMRVLYVALTRAKEKLILTDIKKERTEEEEAAADNYAIRHASSPMKLIRLALGADGGSARFERAFSFPEAGERAAEEVQRAFGEKSRLLDDSTAVDEERLAALRAYDERRYAHPELKGLYIKTSVSELKRAAYEDEEAAPVFETELKEAYVPSFAGAEEGSHGVSRGSAYHRFLELLDFAACPAEGREAFLASQLAAQRKSARLSEEYASLVRLPAMERFLAQDTVRRMEEAARQGKLYREQPFFMGVSAAELKETFPADETVLIQGVIDVYWEEEDCLVLLDYKTDRVTEAEELLRRYRRQLQLYARALGQLRELPVKESLIYSFALDRFISVSDC